MPSSFPCPGTALTILQGYCYKLLRSAKVALGDIKAAESKLESAKLPFPTVLVSDLFTLTFGSSIPKSSYFSVRPQNKSAQKRKEKPSAQSVREGNRAFSFLPSCLPSHMHGLRKLHKTTAQALVTLKTVHCMICKSRNTENQDKEKKLGQRFG